MTTSGEYEIYSDGEMCIAVSPSSYVGYSFDGSPWSTAIFATEALLSDICYGNGKFVATIDSGNGCGVTCWIP